MCRRPLVAISYDPKVAGIMAELGLPVAASTDGLDSRALAEAIIHAWQDREHISGTLSARVEPLAAAARRNVELALSLLPKPRSI
jgi:polysaccharide pyruvyl transferase WcaK-like protein